MDRQSLPFGEGPEVAATAIKNYKMDDIHGNDSEILNIVSCLFSQLPCLKLSFCLHADLIVKNLAMFNDFYFPLTLLIPI